MEDKLVVFQDKKIRRILYNGEWWMFPAQAGMNHCVGAIHELPLPTSTTFTTDPTPHLQYSAN
ncbi:MAG: hypothetical protein PHP95_03275 [Desulfuromonadaceae bacterium]|nr:hypothetical protein [Desulfuromonadaceae bacterium]MDD2847456.1 hypothetical protein [Desulfuromonadaceae bacterium]MDD4131431.1 hypothetical protein [Desulfuromonadaceae bacterium]